MTLPTKKTTQKDKTKKTHIEKKAYELGKKDGLEYKKKLKKYMETINDR